MPAHAWFLYTDLVNYHQQQKDNIPNRKFKAVVIKNSGSWESMNEIASDKSILWWENLNQYAPQHFT